MESVEDQLEAVGATGVPGAVAVAFSPDARIEAAAGFADVRRGEALTVAHRFRIRSVTKIFVAALVLQLVAEGGSSSTAMPRPSLRTSPSASS